MRNATFAVLILSAGMGIVGCASLEGMIRRPTARLTGVSFGDINAEGASLVFAVEVENPYAVALPLTGLEYSLSSGERSLFSGAAEPQGAIPARGTQELSLPVRIGYGELIAALKGIRPGTTIPYDASVDLRVDAPVLGPTTVPLGRQGQLAVPQIPGLGGVNWESVLDTIRVD